MNADEAVTLFRHGIETGRMAHGYVVEGALEGAARETVERLLSVLFCTDPVPPCGQCVGCRQAHERTHPDLTWVEPEKKSRVIGVEQMRAMRQRMLQTSFSGGWKTCVLYAADRLNAKSANTFLKLLEEPPEKTLFLLLTDSPQFLLPTIVSRCQRISISGKAVALPPEWRERMLGILNESGSAGPITAMALADRTVGLLAEVKEQAAQEVKTQAGTEAVEEEDKTLNARIDARYKEKRKQIVQLIMIWYRDLLLATFGLETDALEHGDRTTEIRAKAVRISSDDALENVRVVERMNRMLERNVSESMVLNMAFGSLR